MPLTDDHQGVLISFEGAEGSGKSTQIARLAKRLAKQKHKVLSVREPGGTEIGEQIRNIIVHNSDGDEMCAETEPALTLVYDVPPTISKRRIRQRASDVPDRMERENIEFYKKIRQGYLVLAQSMPERIVVIDGTQTEAEIERQTWKVVKKVIA